MTCRCYPHCPQLPVDNSNLANCLWITFDGGEGVALVCQSCGSIRPTEKAKIGKGAKPPLSRYEKKEVLAQGVLISQQDNHRGYKFQLLCANADNSSILTTSLL